MFKKKVLVVLLSTSLLFLVTLLFDGGTKQHNMFTRMVTLSDTKAEKGQIDNDLKVIEVDTKTQEETKVEDTTLKEDNNTSTVTNTTNEVQQTEQPQQETVVQQEAVYEGLTLDELASKLDRSFKNELSGKGYLYASYSLEKGVDPYLAAAISLEETGCNWNCSNLVKSCNNVGGMKGSVDFGIKELCGFSREYKDKIFIVGAPIESGNSLFNCAVVICNGEVF